MTIKQTTTHPTSDDHHPITRSVVCPSTPVGYNRTMTTKTSTTALAAATAQAAIDAALAAHDAHAAALDAWNAALELERQR